MFFENTIFPKVAALLLLLHLMLSKEPL